MAKPTTTTRKTKEESGGSDGFDKVAVVATDSDVLLGRGNGVASHPGNTLFRELVNKYKPEYLASHRAEKIDIAKLALQEIATQVPPGRFLEKHGDEIWVEIPLHRALEKTCQALREKDRKGRKKTTKSEKGTPEGKGHCKPTKVAIVQKRSEVRVKKVAGGRMSPKLPVGKKVTIPESPTNSGADYKLQDWDYCEPLDYQNPTVSPSESSSASYSGGLGLLKASISNGDADAQFPPLEDFLSDSLAVDEHIFSDFVPSFMTDISLDDLPLPAVNCASDGELIVPPNLDDFSYLQQPNDINTDANTNSQGAFMLFSVWNGYFD